MAGRESLAVSYPLKNDFPSSRGWPLPLGTWATSCCRAPFWYEVWVRNGDPIFVPSCARLANYPRPPASGLWVRSSCHRISLTRCCSRVLSAAAGAGFVYAALPPYTSPFVSSMYLNWHSCVLCFAGIRRFARFEQLAWPDELGTSWSCSTLIMASKMRSSDAGELGAVVPTLMASPNMPSPS